MSYNTTVAEMLEGHPMTREAFKNLTLEVADEWVKNNHPEIKAEWIDICRNKQEIVKLFPDKMKTVKVLDENGNPIMRIMKKRDGTTKEVAVTEEVPYKKGEKRFLNAFEICSWLCDKYGMSPTSKPKAKKVRDNIGNW